MTVHPGNLTHFDAPATSTIHAVAPETLESAQVRRGHQYWAALRGSHAYPAREQLSPRQMAPFLRNVVLVRVVDGGADYEFRIVGDAHVEALGGDFNHLRLSSIEKRMFDFTSRPTYGHVVSTGEPFAVRGWAGRDVPQARFFYSESVFLPLGRDAVDHLLIVSAYMMYAGATG